MNTDMLRVQRKVCAAAGRPHTVYGPSLKWHHENRRKGRGGGVAVTELTVLRDANADKNGSKTKVPQQQLTNQIA